MNELGYIIFFTLLGSIGSLIGGVILLSQERFTLQVSHFLASFAAGTLLGTAFFDLLPEAAHEAESSGLPHDVIFQWAIAGLLFFFILERFIHWFHHHEEHHHDDENEHIHKEAKATIPLIIIGDSIHNFLDGVIIAATFMSSIELGIITTIAVIAHEIPQEIGDFGILLHKGMRKWSVLLINILSAAVSLAGALMTYKLGSIMENILPGVLALTAGFFIYIATSDLIPEIHYEKRRWHAEVETALLLFGTMMIWLFVNFLGH